MLDHLSSVHELSTNIEVDSAQSVTVHPAANVPTFAIHPLQNIMQYVKRIDRFAIYKTDEGELRISIDKYERLHFEKNGFAHRGSVSSCLKSCLRNRCTCKNTTQRENDHDDFIFMMIFY